MTPMFYVQRCVLCRSLDIVSGENGDLPISRRFVSLCGCVESPLSVSKAMASAAFQWVSVEGEILIGEEHVPTIRGILFLR